MSRAKKAKKAQQPADIKRSWVVTVECTVKKSVVTEDCTEDEAREVVWQHCWQETEIEMTDWEVLKVEPNE